MSLTIAIHGYQFRTTYRSIHSRNWRERGLLGVLHLLGDIHTVVFRKSRHDNQRYEARINFVNCVRELVGGRTREKGKRETSALRRDCNTGHHPSGGF
jgi:hypothetical protein